ncbi:hypothetical protein ALC62_13697, partial [Cyphomyrmex costatus]
PISRPPPPPPFYTQFALYLLCAPGSPANRPL